MGSALGLLNDTQVSHSRTTTERGWSAKRIEADDGAGADKSTFTTCGCENSRPATHLSPGRMGPLSTSPALAVFDLSARQGHVYRRQASFQNLEVGAGCGTDQRNRKAPSRTCRDFVPVCAASPPDASCGGIPADALGPCGHPTSQPP